MKYLLALFFAILYEIYASCPNGTFPNVAKNKCYFIPKDSKQFLLAEISCKNQNGNLASISNVFDNMDLTGKNRGCVSLAVRLFETRFSNALFETQNTLFKLEKSIL